MITARGGRRRPSYIVPSRAGDEARRLMGDLACLEPVDFARVGAEVSLLRSRRKEVRAKAEAYLRETTGCQDVDLIALAYRTLTRGRS